MHQSNVNAPTYFPYQNRSTREKFSKNKQFFKDCVEAGITITNWEGHPSNRSGVRPTRKDKILNYNLYNDVVSKAEMNKVVNPFKIKGANFPATYRNYPLLNPNLGVLIGEERKRVFNPVPIVINEDAITERVEKLDAKFSDFLVRNLTSEEFNEANERKALQQMQYWATYTYKDKRERMANQVLQYGIRTQDMNEKFSSGFEDLLISAEEIYVTDIYGGEPIFRKGDPLAFSTVRSGTSNKIEDSEIIVEDAFLPIGQVIDRYYDYLKPEDIKKIEQGHKDNVGAKMRMLTPQLTNDFQQYVDAMGMGAIIEATESDRNAFAGAYDEEGNIRVIRVVWRGRVRVGILEYQDEEGEWQKDIVSEFYEPKTELGEEVKWVWINEWYEGTRIGDDLYVKLGPRDVQMRSADNISLGHPGIVGTVFNVNTGKGRSMMDFGRPWQYLWNFFMYRTELAFARAKGKIGKIQSHLIPDGWTMDQWMYYAEVMGWAVEDGFNEGQHGVARGKLAGNMNQSSSEIDLEMTHYIQNHLMMLEFIQVRADEITGITKQRKGSIDNRETVGGVERAVMQSSHITEKWFGVHDNTKERALAAYLETAKIAWKDKSFKRDFVLDDGTKAILDMDGDMFHESCYGIDISSSASDMEMIQSLRSLSEIYMQNQGSLAIVADLYRTKNPADLQRKIERHEQEIKEAEQEAAEREERMAQEALEMKRMEEEEKIALEREKLDREDLNKQLDREAQIRIAEIRALGFASDKDMNQNQVPDVTEAAEKALGEAKVRVEQKKEKLMDEKIKTEKQRATQKKE